MRHSTTWKRSRSIALLAVGLLIPLGACSDDDEDDDASASDTETTEAADDTATDDTAGDAGGAALTIEGFAFGDVTAAAGATVTITNNDGAPHTVTSDDDAWELARVEGGSEGEITAPAEPGEYAFHCDIHQTMTGSLVVE